MDELREGIEADLASWVVFEDGQIIETGTAGLAESGGSQSVAPDTLFQAASISKPIAVPRCSDWSIAACWTSTRT